ncbi:MAG: TolC family protein [Proteobacteria bacterium]|jgi:outer membrane protein TolC|nr:TolC family protein [Desulfocapsa sp.]MBU3945985.1 TolC family protein [Pseudomonadota bacterium]MCG2742566.1 TolC family protein [Desulfobacteraceae bacterium]MBU4029957.1 TolC family protein [Pseudomonadota bacterium]MBU4044244.1 TolC family protein [Pseudomonadota bacterium]
MKKMFFTRILLLSLFNQALLTFLPGASSGLTIDEAVALALANNPDLQKQQMNRALSEEDLSGQKSQAFGKVDLAASYGYYNLPRTLAPLTPASIATDPRGVPTTVDLFATGIMYEVPLFTGFAQQRSVEIATLEKELAGLALKLSREQLIYNVKSLYVNILSLQAQEEAQKAYYEALQNLYDDILLEVKLGRKARVEQLKAAADLENARVQARQISGNIRIVKAGLSTLLGGETITPLENLSVEMATPGKTEQNKEIEQLDRYRSAALEVEKKARLVDKSRATFYPQVIFNSFYGQNFGPNDSSNLHEGDWNNQEVWQATVNLKWTLFDFGARKTARRMAAVREQQSRRDRVKTELELKKSLSEAEIKIEMARNAFHSAESELALTRETEMIEQVRFDKGATDVNDLLSAKSRNQLALSRSIAARYSYHNGCFYLDYLLENGESK